MDEHNETVEQYRVDVVAAQGATWFRSKYAPIFLGVVSFMESVFAPIIIDPFLIAAILANPRRWKRDTVIAIVASVVGGIVAYIIGALFFDTWGARLIAFYHLDETFAQIARSVDTSAFAFVLIGALTPIPYKLVALAGGLLHINFITFLAASIIGRVLRLGTVGIATHYVGPKALPAVRRHLHRVAALLGLVLGLYLVWQFFLS